MNERQKKHVLLPAALTAGSFFVLTILLFFTSPIRNISYAIGFFLILLILLINLGFLAVYLKAGEVRRAVKLRIYISSFFLVIAVMFKSAQSLNLIDVLVLVVITSGMLFYTGRRAS